jgi:hypothetical protein
MRAGVDHKVDAASLAVEIEFAAIVEDGRRNRKDTAIWFAEAEVIVASSFYLRCL